MKKNLLFHPLVRGLCLILCLTALLGCAYTGLRCIFMDTSGVMENKPEFSPLTYYSGAVGGDVIYWPGNYEWNELIIISGEDRWYYNDDLLNRIVDLLSRRNYRIILQHRQKTGIRTKRTRCLMKLRNIMLRERTSHLKA